MTDASKSCALCRICSGAAYQAPPIHYLGDLQTAQILVVAQNPGELTNETDIDFMRFVNDRIEGDSEVWHVMKTWGRYDFLKSRAYDAFQKVFGSAWLASGKFVYTNAVRCRTPRNAPPSDEMQMNCATYTRALIDRNIKLLVMVGAMAKRQILGDDRARIDAYQAKAHPHLNTIVSIPHYAAHEYDAARARDIFKTALKHSAVPYAPIYA